MIIITNPLRNKKRKKGNPARMSVVPFPGQHSAAPVPDTPPREWSCGERGPPSSLNEPGVGWEAAGQPVIGWLGTRKKGCRGFSENWRRLGLQARQLQRIWLASRILGCSRVRGNAG